ncbi:MAG: hypothetical protein Q9227_005167 [Pyrenula ochraceoflavens]
MHGCQPPPRYPHRDPLGLGRDLIRDRMNAYTEGWGQSVYTQHFEAYGKTFEETSYGRRIISTMEPANFQHVAAMAFQDFTKLERNRTGVVSQLLGPGILVTNGDEWKWSRDLIKPIFSRGEVADITIIDKHVQSFFDILPHDRGTIDVQPLIQNMFLDVASEFLLGESFNALSTEPPAETKAFLKDYDDALRGYARWRSAPWLYYWIYRFDFDYRRSCSNLHGFIDKFVYRALEETGAHEETSDDATNEPRLDHSHQSKRYTFVNELAKQIRDPIKIRREVTNVFLVARDNVAGVTANALFHLARNPEIWTQLRRTSLQLGTQPLTFELLKSLTAFKHVVHETLRVQGPSPYILRTASKATILPTGGGLDGKSPIDVEPGTAIHLNIWSMNHDKEIWGHDVDEFKPERWANSDQRHMWDFVPFWGGPRICPAIQQVYTHFVYFMVKLTQRFEGVENRDSTENYVTTFKMTFESRNGVKIALVPAQNPTA